MPTLKNAEIVSHDPQNPAPITRALRAILAERISADTGLKIRRIVREVDKLSADVEAERQRFLALHAEKGEDGEPKVEEGRYILADPAGFAADFAALMNAEVQITEYLVPGDLVRKVRDESGKVYEADDYDGEVFLWLGNLLQETSTNGNGAGPSNGHQ